MSKDKREPKIPRRRYKKIVVETLRTCVRRTFLSVLSTLTRPEYLYLMRDGNGWYNIINQPARFPPFLNMVDIAGLVKGASEGQGLGNAFLSHIRACDALLHLCRTFEGPGTTHVEGKVDPI